MSDEVKYLWGRRNALILRVIMNRYYHQERQRIFDLREGFVKVISILAGSVAFANVLNSDVIKICSVIITLASALSLVFGFGTKSRDSAKRSAEWALHERDIELAGERGFTEDMINKFVARCSEIEAGEPAPHPGLLERCYVRACAITESTPKQKTIINKWNAIRPIIFIH